jgi:hypothetical protein
MPTPDRHAPPLRRQYDTMKGSLRRIALRRGVSLGIIIPEQFDDHNAPPPAPPPAPIKEWYQSEPIAKTSKVINTGACVFGLLYAALAIRQVSENLSFTIFYGASSFLMNAPPILVFYH